ncbi:MAG: SDR family NAD(P)-dependent oxidoreductase [Gemmatimonadales bacterium]
MIDLTGRVILVTGGSRGIGAVIVRTLARAGAQVVLHYGRHRDAAEAVAAESPAGQCHLVHADLAVPGAVAQLWKESVAWQGHVDVVVNNAAVATSTRIEDPLEQWEAMWRETLQVNVMAVADVCREALLHFRSRGGGTIINIASRAAFRGDEPDYMHYAASKGAVVALTKSIARGFGREHVVAYGIAPGWVLTDMARPAIQARGLDALTRDIPLGSMARPEDVANVAAFLASGLAPHATGTTIDINGASYVR